jgi:hypothetical protein
MILESLGDRADPSHASIRQNGLKNNEEIRHSIITR